MLYRGTAGLFDRLHNVCVIGAGPVGIAMALEMARLGQQVTLVESGLMRDDPEAQALSEAIHVNARQSVSMALAVRRGFGGTSDLWGAACIPLDPTDFEARPLTGGIHWPLSYSEFAAWLPMACRYANCGEGFVHPLPGLAAADPAFGADGLARYADPPSFRKAYAGAVTGSKLIDAFLGVTVTGFRFSECGRVAALKAQGRDGAVGVIEAKTYVLACGGVETTRLMLAAQAEAPACFGGEDGPLGRYYMGHLSGAIADIRIADPVLDGGLDFFRPQGAAYARRRLVASPALKRRESLTNVAFWPTPPPMRDPANRDPVLSLAYLALSLPPLGRRLVSESLRRVNVGDGGDKAAHLVNVLSGLPQLADFLPRFLYRRFLARRRLPGLHLRNPARRYLLHYHAEQLPSAQSRIRLANERDRLGLPKAVIDLNVGAADADPIVRSHEHLADWLKRTGKGDLIWHGEAAGRRASVLAQAGDGVHQIGSARMAETARQGVVDRDCRVFGCNNLFVAGSAVFPTSGHANPTLSALALGLRQAHLIAAEAAGR